jgi:two-component system LytT family response regulator
MYLSTYSPFDVNPKNTFILPTSTGVEIIDCSSLVRIAATSNYCKLFFSDGRTLVVAKLLSWFETRLSSRGFIRLHRSHMVNMQYILRLNKDKRTEVVLKDLLVIPVSRRKKQYCKKVILQSDGIGGGVKLAA